MTFEPTSLLLRNDRYGKVGLGVVTRGPGMLSHRTFVCAYSKSEHNVHNASMVGFDLQYTIQCQLTKPADKLQHCIIKEMWFIQNRNVIFLKTVPHSFIVLIYLG